MDGGSRGKEGRQELDSDILPDMALFHAALRRASLPVLHASEDIRSETESSGPFFARKGGGGDAAASAYLADTLQAQVRKLSEQVHELKSALVDRDLEILNVKDAHANDIARFRETLRQKNSELARAQRHGDALKRDEQDIIFSENRRLRSRLEELTGKVASEQTLKLSLDASQARVGNLERLLAEKERDLSILARDLVDHKSEVSRLSQSLEVSSSATHSALADANAAIKRLQAEREDLVKQTQSAHAALKRVRDREATAVQALTGQDGTISQLRAALESAQLEREQYKRSCEALSSELEGARASAADAAAVLRESKRLSAMKHALEDAFHRLEECEAERNTALARAQFLEQQLYENKSQFAEQITTLQQVADNRSRVIEALQQDLQSYAGAAAEPGDSPSKEHTKLRREMEALARKLSARESDLREAQAVAAEQTRVATRLSLLLEEREAQLSRSAQGGHTSPGKPDRESGAVGGDDSSSLMSFLFLRDSEAEGVFGCLQSLLSESQQLLTLLQLKLSSSERDGDASALAQVVNYTSRRGVPPVNRTLRSKRLGDLLAAHSSHASTDAAVLDEDATVLDRPSLIAAVTTHTQAVTDSRIAVAKALSEDVGKECAMQ